MSENPNLFLTTMQRHRGGKDLADVSLRLSEAVAAVASTGKPGSVTLTIKVKPAKRGQNAVVVETDLKAKVPSIEPEASFWFATPEGSLQTEDPRQMAMFGAQPPMVVVGGASKAIQDAVVVATAGAR
jgi:hypothetical protein